MKQKQTLLIRQFLETHNHLGSPEQLLKKLIIEDFKSLEDLKSIENLEIKLKILGSLRGFTEPKYIELPSDICARTKDGKIEINATHVKSRQLFAWAHEIVHSYFNSSTKVEIECIGGTYSFIGENVEEETLCNFGASEILFYGINAKDFSVETLQKIAQGNGLSKEATACFMRKYAPENGGIIVWKRMHRKSENPHQSSLFDEDQQPFRIHYALVNGNLFLPKNKSVNSGEAINECEQDGFSFGVIELNLPSKVLISTDNLLIGDKTVLTLFKVI
jgi:Zn-dependent peptidase ImmA (M78 family)